MPRGSAPSGRGPGETRTRAAHAPGAVQPDHRLKQDPRWKVEQITPATFRWTAPSGRSSTTEPTRYPI